MGCYLTSRHFTVHRPCQSNRASKFKETEGIVARWITLCKCLILKLYTTIANIVMLTSCVVGLHVHVKYNVLNVLHPFKK